MRYDKLNSEFDWRKICQEYKDKYKDEIGASEASAWEIRFRDEYNRRVAQRLINNTWFNLPEAPKSFKF